MATKYPGEYFIQISFIGFKEISRRELNIRQGDNQIDTFKLDLKNFSIDEVAVTAKGTDNIVGLEGHTFNVNEAMVLKAKDTKQLLNLVPGVRIDKDYRIKVEGDLSVLLMIDGIEQIDCLSKYDAFVDGFERYDDTNCSTKFSGMLFETKTLIRSL